VLVEWALGKRLAPVVISYNKRCFVSGSWRNTLYPLEDIADDHDLLDQCIVTCRRNLRMHSNVHKQAARSAM